MRGYWPIGSKIGPVDNIQPQDWIAAEFKQSATGAASTFVMVT